MIKIGSRGSKLALWQANLVRNSLINRGIESQIIVIKTSGDKIKDKPLYEFGGKGLFIKEIEEALIARDIDMAVHSMKDVPATIAEGTRISAYLKRESPFDAFIQLYEYFLLLRQRSILCRCFFYWKCHTSAL